jgi:dihydrofolate synthase / folylpolyglutamate synthase
MSLSNRLPPGPTAYESAVGWLYARVDHERSVTIAYGGQTFKLSRMCDLLARLGDPQQSLPILHIAGTKGKGSTAAMAAAILTAAGYRTGLFTSPHLNRVEERLAINGCHCPAERLAELLQRVEPVVEAMDQGRHRGVTFFEIITAVAFLYFAESKVDAVVLEVGLGGRLDSTNVCRPLVSVITSISLDHTEQLGGTLEAIAREKAGIIKRGVPVVSGVLDPGPREVIRQVAAQRRARLVELGVDFEFTYRPPHGLERAASMGTVDVVGRADGHSLAYRDLGLGLLGRHQGANAAVALATLAELQYLGWNIPEQAVRRGLSGLVWPARVEVISRRPTVVLDAAHNAASVSALVATLDESFSVRRRLLVFAASQGKDLAGMLRAAVERFDEVILTQYLDSPRAVPVEELDALAVKLAGRHCHVCPSPAEAWQLARSLAGPEDMICITGSFFLAAQMRREIERGKAVDNAGNVY